MLRGVLPLGIFHFYGKKNNHGFRLDRLDRYADA